MVCPWNPLESAYSDDSVFGTVGREWRESATRILEIASDILNDWSLLVNESKIVFTRVYLAGVTEVDSHDKKIKAFIKNGGTLYFCALSYAQKGTSPTDVTRLTSPSIPTTLQEPLA